MRLPGIEYDSPVAFTWRQRLALAVIPPCAGLAVGALCRTLRWEARGVENPEAGLAIGRGHALMAFWHECLMLAGWRYRGNGGHTLTSYSFDGELAARVIRKLGLEAVRGSSSRGGSGALKNLEAVARLVPWAGFTLDGPRGPRRVAKSGIAILAARTGLPVVPMAYAVSRCKRLRSWDRFPVPMPGARVLCAYAPPIAPPASEEPEVIESKRRQIEFALNALHTEIEAECGGQPF